MISLVIQRLEALRTDLVAIDPEQRIDAADKVAEMASELRRVVAIEPRDDEPASHNHTPKLRTAG